jgi:hypothetical protein
MREPPTRSGLDLQRAVIIAMVAMRMMQVAFYQVVDMVAVRHPFVAAIRIMNVPFIVTGALMVSRASVGVRCVHFKHVLINMIPVHMVQVPVMQVIDVPVSSARRGDRAYHGRRQGPASHPKNPNHSCPPESRKYAVPGRFNTYEHKNKSFRGFGSYGDILVRDRKMYVAPTPFALAEGTAHRRTLILPATEKPGRLHRRRHAHAARGR